MDHASAVMTFVLETLKWPKVSWSPRVFRGGVPGRCCWGGLPWIEGRESVKFAPKDGEELLGFDVCDTKCDVTWMVVAQKWLKKTSLWLLGLLFDVVLNLWSLWYLNFKPWANVPKEVRLFSSKDCGQGSRPNGAVNGLIYDEVNLVWAVSMKKCSLSTCFGFQ